MKILSTVDEVFEAVEAGGGEAYFGEPVTVLEHSLQAASFVKKKGAADTLVVAALLHDVGHLLHLEGEDAAQHGLDTRHEELAVEALDGHLPPSVLEPIRLHVAAKRYLCFAEPRYLAGLSAASLQSLALQGGVMSAAEAEEFHALEHAQDAVRLRRADEAAKVKGLKVPGLESYRELVAGLWS